LSFRGHSASGHRDMVAPLHAAEEAVRDQTVSPAIYSFGCFNARSIRGNAHRLSNHALGRAIDLNPDDNPRITQAADFKIIAAVTSTELLHQTQPAVMRQASQAFQSGFTPAWIGAQTDPEIVAALRDPHLLERLHGYARRGFSTLYLPLIDALIAAGLQWGGGWHTSKDFMHFELPESVGVIS
jgi:hypothetical protein